MTRNRKKKVKFVTPDGHSNQSQYYRKEVLSPEEVHSYITIEAKGVDKNAIINGDKINMTSQRYVVFGKSCTCVTCGAVGTFYAKEIIKSDYHSAIKENRPPRYHFNLYAMVDGEEVLMTKDHITPKSKGGKNILSNYQTMCTVCNFEKGSN